MSLVCEMSQNSKDNLIERPRIGLIRAKLKFRIGLIRIKDYGCSCEVKNQEKQ